MRGYANLGATVNVGRYGELRAGVQHEFGMNDDTNANIRYTHYFNDNRSQAHLYANTNERYEAGIEHMLTDTVSMSAMLFSEQYRGDRSNGGMLGFTHRFGAGKAPVLRTVDNVNANVRMNAQLKDVLHTISPHAVKNVHHLGNIVTTQTVEESSDQTIEKMDTEPKFTAPKVEVNGNTLIVTDHGIEDADGITGITYVLYMNGNKILESKDGKFENLKNGEYTIETIGGIVNGSTGQVVATTNKFTTTKIVDVAPIRTPEMIKAEVEAYMDGVTKEVDL